jgi:hypothetical protein
MAKRGRPTKMPSAADRAKVKELLANKAPLSDIAKLLGFSIPTLRKYFPSEISSEKKSGTPKRPARKVTDAQRDKVKRYIGCKMPVEQVALVLGYEGADDLDAFKEDFAREIEIGSAVYRATVLDKLNDQMVAGTMGATNRLETLTQMGDPSAPAAKAGGVGKKEAAQDRANEVANRFRTIGPPTLKAVK